MIFFVQVSTTDVSPGADDMNRAVNEGAPATNLDDSIATPLVMLMLLLCAVKQKARLLNWARVAKRSRDFIIALSWMNSLMQFYVISHVI